MVLACLAGPAHAVSNTSAAPDWRLTPGQAFNGVEGALDSAVRLWVDNAAGQASVCSGTLLAGGRHVLTAAHCAADFTSLRVDFGLVDGVASESRGVAVGGVWLHSGWDGTLSSGADIAVLTLDAPVTGIRGATLSNGNDLGRDFLFAGYGSTTTGDNRHGGAWTDPGFAHWGMNSFDVTSQVFKDATRGGGDNRFGETWLFDFDAQGVDRSWRHNTLQLMANMHGKGWSSSAGLGDFEAFLAPGDSGAGAFVWDGSQWLLSGVMSWTMQYCQNTRVACDYSTANASSFGDIAGATAVFSHTEWILGIIDAGQADETRGVQVAMMAVTAVPEPGSYALFGAGLLVLGWASRRRRITSPLR